MKKVLLALLLAGLALAADAPKPITPEQRAKLWELYARQLSSTQQADKAIANAQAAERERIALLDAIRLANPGFEVDENLKLVAKPTPEAKK